jgi:hypothetical protein
MESKMAPDILQAAIEERYRLEALLRSNLAFQQFEAVCRVIGLYERVAEVPAGADPVANSDLSGRTDRPDPVPNPDLPTIIPSSDPSTLPDPLVRRRRGGWTWYDSETTRIRNAAVEYLRKKGCRAKGTEISSALASNGVKINSQKPSSVVAARLTASPLFDHTPDGYGLREWSNGRAPRNDGPINGEQQHSMHRP